jgi:hypothetical protein
MLNFSEITLSYSNSDDSRELWALNWFMTLAKMPDVVTKLYRKYVRMSFSLSNSIGDYFLLNNDLFMLSNKAYHGCRFKTRAVVQNITIKENFN